MARRMRRRRNPEDELPTGEWIPTHAVMFNEDGTVSVMTEHSGRTGNRHRNASDRPEIHVYGEGNEWTYSILLPNGSYRHYMEEFSFSSPEAALKHAEDHIGLPGYGGELGTVENWQDPEVHIHYEGWEPAGIFALGPSRDAMRMRNRR